MQDRDALTTLAWLVEAGADEAVADAPVNRLVAKPSAPAAPVPPTPRASASRAASAPPPPKAPTSGGDAIGDAMKVASAARNLGELKAAMEAFESSALKRAATNTVFADGTPAGRVMFIGEAPGRDEDRPRARGVRPRPNGYRRPRKMEYPALARLDAPTPDPRSVLPGSP